MARLEVMNIMLSSNDYIQFLQTQDTNYAILLLLGGLVAVQLMRWQGKQVTLPAVPIWFLILIAFFLPLSRILTEPLWYDETFSVVTSRLSYEGLLTVLLSDVHTPTHYTLLHIWIHLFGDSQVAVRIPSLITGLITVFVSYRLARTFYDEHLASWSALLVAVSPMLIHYSAETRYPIFLLLSVLVALLAIRENWKIKSVLVAVPAWWHITAIPYCLCLIWYDRHNTPLRQKMVTLLLSSVFVPLALMQAGDVVNGFWLRLRFPLEHLIMNFAIRQNEGVILLIPLIGALTILSFKHQRYVLLIWGVPIAIWIVSALVVPVYLFRTLMASVVLMLIFSTPLLLRRNTLAFIITLMLSSYVMYFTGTPQVRFLDALDYCQDTDYIVPTATGMTMYFLYHSDKPVYTYGINTNSQFLNEPSKKVLQFTRPPSTGVGCYIMQKNYETQASELIFTAGKRNVASLWAGQFTTLEVFHG